MQAKDFMTRGVISISPEHSVSHAARIMLENHISGLLVRDDQGQLLGVLSEGDLLRRAELGPAAWRSSTEKQHASAERFIKSHSWQVGDVMTRKLVTVDGDTPLDRVAAIMAANQVNRVPVMQGDEILGIVTRSDILRAVATSVPDVAATGDQAKRRAVFTRLTSDLGLDRESIDVTVDDGIVCLWGEVESEAKREAARVVAEKIGGVGCVKNRLRVVSS
ncbi:CBS domain-containing protein [Sinorhizobium alkalisoli]|uniref:Signal transduction protein n=1 Tax=Sinorhizobium alkalisoli TaxID=1752398 RepID=A0A1E3V7C3_9HYPH|nr:CBS domain-containing protein [Sinorhizobium alkalisoli]MCG5478966.1 CBS domain-containing protein [Sinorhizobium alkalisoli]ODR89542.1 signal transduction protein [Sinorhizobium alkalisoli]